jgi:signal recognition particle receptor subunit beta
MVQFNFSERTIKAKVVYYGPPQSGKTTNLEQIHRISDPDGSNRLISLNTAQDRTLFFDLLPFSLGTVSGYDFKIQLYTVPGQVQYNATRRVVLAGADAVVFVADSRQPMARENQAAFENMKVNLLANRLVPEKVPFVVQYNKQDLAPLSPREELDRTLNAWGRKAFPAVAARGEGVMETFEAVVQDMLAAIAVKYNLKEKGLDPEAVPGIVAQAFAEIVRKAPARVPAALAPPPPPRVVIAEPQGVEPAYPGQVGPEVSPVSEELLHRAIRSNVELAQALGQVVRDMSEGLGTVLRHAGQLAAVRDEASRATGVAAIQREVQRLQQLLRDMGQSPSASRPGGPPRAPAPPQTPPTPPRGTTAPPPGVPVPAPAAVAPRPAPPLRLQRQLQVSTSCCRRSCWRCARRSPPAG